MRTSDDRHACCACSWLLVIGSMPLMKHLRPQMCRMFKSDTNDDKTSDSRSLRGHAFHSLMYSTYYSGWRQPPYHIMRTRRTMQVKQGHYWVAMAEVLSHGRAPNFLVNTFQV